MRWQFWIGLGALVGAALYCFLSAQNYAGDTVWDETGSSLRILIGSVLALITAVYGFVGALRADRRRSVSGTAEPNVGSESVERRIKDHRA
jgi:hypothetical protein